MKKIIIYTAAFASMALALASCEKEPSTGDGQKGAMRLHVVSDEIQTKSDTPSASKIVSETIDLSEGDINLFLSATEEDNLGNEFITRPATKGEIITTENFADKRSGDFNLWLTTSGNSTYKEAGRAEAKNVPAVLKDDYWYAMYNAGGSEFGDYIHWPEEGGSLNFWCWSGACASGFEIAADGNTMTFGYSGASTKASEQSDLLFAYAGNKTEPNTKGDVEIHFDHALAAVQFCIGKLDEGVCITNIKLTGVKNSGNGTFIPGNHGKENAELFSWTVGDATSEYSTGEISSNFIYSSESDLGKPFGSEAMSTFFLIPQSVEDIEVEISVKSTRSVNGVSESSTLKKKIGLGSVSSATMPAWKAGKIYRYTLSGTGEVDVTVNETFNEAKTTKSDVKAQNTGTISSWIRGIVIANWCEMHGEAIAPYTGSISFDTSKWEKKDDGFYYYKEPVLSGDSTDALISSFSVDKDNMPNYHHQDVHVEMKVIFQAVEYQKNTTYGPSNFAK